MILGIIGHIFIVNQFREAIS